MRLGQLAERSLLPHLVYQPHALSPLFFGERVSLTSDIKIAVHGQEPALVVEAPAHIIGYPFSNERGTERLCRWQTVEIAFTIMVSGRCRVLQVVVSALTLHHFQGMEEMQACGVFVAVQSATLVEGILSVHVSGDEVNTMYGLPVDAAPESVHAAQTLWRQEREESVGCTVVVGVHETE